MLKRIAAAMTALLLGATLLVSAEEEPAAAGTAAADNGTGCQTVAENDRFVLSADLQTGDFTLKVNASGYIWSSGQWEVLNEESDAYANTTGRTRTDLVSLIGINYVQNSTIASTAVPSYQNSYAYCVKRSGVQVSRIENGYRATFTFADVGATVPVEITLQEDGIRAEIPGNEIQTGDEYSITSIELLPGFTAASSRETGYLFVPSGSGALVDIGAGRGDLCAYSAMVYGDDAAIEQEEYTGKTQNICVPVYGIKRGDEAVTAIIAAGDSQSRINAESNSSTSDYTRVYSEYVTAIVDSTTLFESDYSNQRIIYGIEKRQKLADYAVDFRFLTGADANYSGMAQVYRRTLALSSTAAAPQMYLTLYGAGTKKASFLGIPYTKTIALTGFSDATVLLEELNGADIPVALQYIGWNNTGVENQKVPTRFAPVRVLGGKKGFESLYAAGEQHGNTLYFDADFLSIRRSGHGFSVLSDVSKSIFGTRTPQYKYMRSVYVPVNNENPWYLLTPGNVLEAAETFLSRYRYGGGLSLSGVGSMVYSDFKNNACQREQTVAAYVALLDQAARGHTLSVQTGNAYTYPYVRSVYTLPSTSDGNLIFSRDVPFLQMVLHGAVSYGAEAGNSLLDCLEYGANPYYAGITADDSTLIETTFNWLSGTTAANWLEDAKTTYAAYAAVYRELYDQPITAHRSENDVSATEFANGTTVYVNRTGADAVLDGVTVPANGYTVMGGQTK